MRLFAKNEKALARTAAQTFANCTQSPTALYRIHNNEGQTIGYGIEFHGGAIPTNAQALAGFNPQAR